MQRSIAVVLAGAIACAPGSSDTRRHPDSPRIAVAVWPEVLIVNASETLNPAIVDSLGQCKLNFHLKAGMTNREANDAIDAGYQKFFTCIRTRGREAGTSG
jgi:hypothetical protein